MHFLGCVLSMTTCKSRVSTTSNHPSPNNKRDVDNSLGRELRINCAVGDEISGILYKWVNFGKGWRPRWFVLQDGVLSYYKIRGPNKILVNKESAKGSRVIGDKSSNWILRQQQQQQQIDNQHKINANKRKKVAVGEIYLKVSSIHENQSGNKKFSIFTGTKWLHLRAENEEDRTMWMEAFQAVKDILPKTPRAEVRAPIDNLEVSTEKLREILLREGVNPASIHDIEQIMKDEFASLEKQLIVLKQKHWLLKDTLRQLEVHVNSKKSHKSSSSKNSAVLN